MQIISVDGYYIYHCCHYQKLKLTMDLLRPDWKATAEHHD